ncbi:MAG: GH39 family glycosyl hydrolase [Lachnospiraceae bacterium]
MFIHSNLSLNLNAQLEHIDQSFVFSSEEYTFMILQQGTLRFSYPDNSESFILEKHDFILISPDENITILPVHSTSLIRITLDQGFIQSITPLNHRLACNSVKHSNADDQKLRDILLRICAAYITIADRALMISLVYELIDALNHSFMESISTASLQSKKEETNYRITQITDYIKSHSHTKISLNDLADELFLSPQYLSKFIKKNLDCNFTSFLTQIRLKNAVYSLENMDTSITMIALDCGFSSLTAFNRIFKNEYQISPTEYRKKYLKNQLAFHTGSFTSQELPIKEPNNDQPTIKISCERSFSLRRPWCDTINIGALSHAQKHSFHENFNRYHAKANFKYVRFSNMFSEQLVTYHAENDEFDFYSLEILLSSFQRIQVIPFIELSFKPNKGMVDISAKGDDYYIHEKDLSYYLKALDVFLRYAINHFGYSYVKQWRFEIWNKLDENLSPLESTSEYIQKFRSFEAVIRSIVPECMIGGPGFNMSGQFDNFIQFISDISKSDLHMDFISFTGYCYKLRSHSEQQDRATLGILSTDPSHLKSVLKMFKNHLKRTGLYSDLPIFITEFGSTLSVKNYIPESVFQAAFISKSILDVSEYADSIAYAYLSDNQQPLNTSERTAFSFPGLIGENGIAKPSFHAFSFLFHLGRELISKGNDYILTRNSENQYQLLYFHYVHFSKNFCLNSWEEVDIMKTYDIFEQAEQKHMNFEFSHISPGKYKVTRFSLNRNYGSILDKYLRIIEISQMPPGELLSIIANLREDEIEYYQKTSLPRQDIFFIECRQQLELEFVLDPHEVVFLELNRIL